MRRRTKRIITKLHKTEGPLSRPTERYETILPLPTRLHKRKWRQRRPWPNMSSSEFWEYLLTPSSNMRLAETVSQRIKDIWRRSSEQSTGSRPYCVWILRPLLGCDHKGIADYVQFDPTKQRYNHPAQTLGKSVCVPKRQAPPFVNDYRTFSLHSRLNNWCLSVMTSNDPWWHYQSQSTLLRTERTIKDAAFGIRDIVAYAVQTQRGICILSLDFRTAFDKASHDYLHNILREFYFDDTLVIMPCALYKNATSSYDVNGFLPECFSSECSVRYGCPLTFRNLASYI